MSPKPDPLLRIRDLHKTVGGASNPIAVLRGIDLTVEAGEFVAVMGPSGSGKSTLLNLIAGLDAPGRGSIHFAGQELTSLTDDERALLRRRRIGVVFQNFQLLDMLTAEENVALPLVIAGQPRREARRRAALTLDVLGLERRRGSRPGELSGGEQQRVAVARALVIEPCLLLADEPTGNLDSTSSAGMLRLFRDLADRRRHAIVLVTHDPRQAAVADRVVSLLDGRIHATSGAGLPGSVGTSVTHVLSPPRSQDVYQELHAPGNPATSRPYLADLPGSGAGRGGVGGGCVHGAAGPVQLPRPV